MTYREKLLSNLNVLEIKPDHLLTLAELKQSYLRLTKLYHPDNDNPYTDSKKYFMMKDSYDYLYDHIDLANEELTHIINGDVEKVDEEIKPEVVEPIMQERVRAVPIEEVKIDDRPSWLLVFFSLLSPLIGFILFFMTRRVTPKSSWLYLGIGIITFIINVFVIYRFFPELVMGVR